MELQGCRRKAASRILGALYVHYVNHYAVNGLANVRKL
jgi:hypothetical protein